MRIWEPIEPAVNTSLGDTIKSVCEGGTFLRSTPQARVRAGTPIKSRIQTKHFHSWLISRRQEENSSQKTGQGRGLLRNPPALSLHTAGTGPRTEGRRETGFRVQGPPPHPRQGWRRVAATPPAHPLPRGPVCCDGRGNPGPQGFHTPPSTTLQHYCQRPGGSWGGQRCSVRGNTQRKGPSPGSQCTSNSGTLFSPYLLS